MMQKHILFFGGNRLRVHEWKAGHVHLENEFSPDSAGLEAFDAWLGKHRGSLLYLLADVTEEGFQLEDIPWVRGKDRSALIKRRLSQYFYGTTLAVALSLGRATEGRRDERMLFAALTHADSFAPWLGAMRRAEAILAGVWSVPLVLAECGPRWINDTGPALLITPTAGGVRQTFFDAGRLRFSRLTPLATRSQNELARVIGNESVSTWQYLVGQRQIRHGTTVRVVVLTNAEQMPVIQQHCHNSDELVFEFIDLGATARSDGLKTPPGAVDDLIAHHLAAKPSRLQFARSPDRRFYRLWQLRFALTRVALIILAGGLLFAAKTGIDVHELRQEIAATESRTLLATQHYNALLESLPKVSVTPDNLRALMERLGELQKRSPDLEPLLAHLAQVLNETPKVELVRLEWKSAPRPDTFAKVPGGTQSAGAGGTTPTAAGNGSNDAWAVLELQAQLPLGLSADLRAQKEIIDTFAERLKNPQTVVQILAMPFDIESGKPLKSRSEPNDNGSGTTPKFSLAIARLL